MKNLLFLILISYFFSCFGQQNKFLLFMYGKPTDNDWEILKVDTDKNEFYYNYAGRKGETIKLDYQGTTSLKNGDKAFKVQIPNFSKKYLISMRMTERLEEFIILKMEATDGTYQKEFKMIGENSIVDGDMLIRNDMKILSVLNKWLEMSPDFCSSQECSPEKIANGSSCQMGIDIMNVKAEYGEINQDKVADVLISFKIIMCVGENEADCNPSGQILLLSNGLDYKVIDQEHLFSSKGACIRTLTTINVDGSINGEDLCWHNNEKCPSLTQKTLYKLVGTTLIQIQTSKK